MGLCRCCTLHAKVMADQNFDLVTRLFFFVGWLALINPKGYIFLCSAIVLVLLQWSVLYAPDCRVNSYKKESLLYDALSIVRFELSQKYMFIISSHSFNFSTYVPFAYKQDKNRKRRGRVMFLSLII